MSNLPASEDFEFETTEESEENEAFPAPQYEIFSYPNDTTLKGYLELWNKSQLYIPDFQRDFVWDQTRASKLIESFLLGLPVPPVFLYKPSGSKSFWVIDGQQRIRSVVDFLSGVFGEQKFRLKGVDSRWVGKSFSDLSEDEQFTLETTVLRAIIIQQTHPADHTSIYHIFERLNTGGIRLNAMEVRQCVYASDFLAKLKELNALTAWQNVIGATKPDKRLRDVELILRVIAFYVDAENYEKPMKKFLNGPCIDMGKASGAAGARRSAEIEAVFRKTIEAINSQLGPKPFHLRGRLNFSALDVVVATLMRSGIPVDLNKKFGSLVSDPAFQDAVSFNTSDESVVKVRFDLARQYLS